MLSRLPPRRWLAIILLLTVLARVAFVALFSDTLSLQTSGYDTYAVNLLDGHFYGRLPERGPDSDLPPLYPFFLAGVYSVFGRDALAVAGVQIALDALTVLLVFWIGRRVGGEAVGLLAAAFYGLYPYLLYQNLTLNDTGLFILLLAAAVAAAYRVRDTQAARWAVALGLAVGLGALTKTWILLVLALLALDWWRALGFRAALRLALVAGGVALLVLAPWAIRNTRLHGELVLVSTNSGSNLHQGNNACVADYLARGWDAQWVSCIARAPADLSEVAADRWHRAQALDYLRAHPRAWPRLFATKLWVLWAPIVIPYDLPPGASLLDDAVLQFQSRSFQIGRVVHALYFAPLLALGAAGLVWAWRDRRPIGPLLAVFAAVTITYLVFHPSTRYRAPADPFVFVLAAYAVARLWARLRARGGPPVTWPRAQEPPP